MELPPCIMYVYQRSYIYLLMVLKRMLPADTANIMKVILANNYASTYLCKEKSKFTEWGDLDKGFCGNVCWDWFHNYSHNKVRIRPALKISEPKFGRKVPVNDFPNNAHKTDVNEVI